jgi:hypothetical protein
MIIGIHGSETMQISDLTGSILSTNQHPVSAGMVTHPAKYRWSSYRSNGQGEHQDWLTPHPEYLALGNYRATRLAS